MVYNNQKQWILWSAFWIFLGVSNDAANIKKKTMQGPEKDFLTQVGFGKLFS